MRDRRSLTTSTEANAWMGALSGQSKEPASRSWPTERSLSTFQRREQRHHGDHIGMRRGFRDDGSGGRARSKVGFGGGFRALQRRGDSSFGRRPWILSHA